ncbi:MAG TPA: glycosyltransferase [Verrucomicrobiae bacterium]
MIFLEYILGGLACLSCALAIWQWLAARQFPLHRKIAVPGYAPAVSILKPLKGCDETTSASLASWFQQEYAGPIEIIFGVADARDPVCTVVREVMARHPSVPARLIVCENLSGTNAKMAKLAQLEKLAAHPLILISDADVRVPPFFLASFVAPLRDEKNALVNCFYRLANPSTAAMRWEAVAINADFWSQVLQSQTLKPLDFALGAAIVLRRPALAQIGGFAALADCLADDYQLGHRIARNGHRIALCPLVVECWDSPQTWRQVWKHQIRWARTIRVCQPGPYFSSIIANAGFWATVWFIAAMVAGNFVAAALAAALLVIRTLIALRLQKRFTPGNSLVSPFWLVPLRDWLNAAIWCCAFLGNTVEWRGRRMRVRRDGVLVGISSASQ